MVQVTLKNGTVKEVTTTEELFELHFGADVLWSDDYATALAALRSR